MRWIHWEKKEGEKKGGWGCFLKVQKKEGEKKKKKKREGRGAGSCIFRRHLTSGGKKGKTRVPAFVDARGGPKKKKGNEHSSAP